MNPGDKEAMESKLGSCIMKVPIVQELAKEQMASVPSRYVRPNHDDDHHLIPPPSSSTQIPIIDLHSLFDPDFMDSELHKLHTACKEWGFFQLINHGVKPCVIETMRLQVEEFFNLPIEEKNKFCQKAGDVEGYGQIFVVSQEQKLDWGDMFYLVTLPTCLRKPHLIPKLPSQFRVAIQAYAQELEIVAMKILGLMAKALGINAEEFETLFDQGRQALRMNYYPPCPQPELVTGLSPHSDSNGLTILLQANETEGLQIKKDGYWVPVSPLPDAFVINIGDISEIVTNGIYRSIEHRVIVNTKKERISVATFFSPKMDGEIGPSPSIVGPQNPPKFKRIGYADYLKGLFSKQLDGKSYLDAMRL